MIREEGRDRDYMASQQSGDYLNNQERSLEEKTQEDVELFDSSTKRQDYCRRVLKFCFSHIGLCGMVVAYSVAGGFIFEHLEKTNEKQECVKAMQKYVPFENETVYKLWDIAQNFQESDYKEQAFMVSSQRNL